MDIICAKCEGTFSCGSKEATCWCKAIDLSTYTMKFLETNFSGCLCTNCLQPFAVVDLDAEVEEEE